MAYLEKWRKRMVEALCYKAVGRGSETRWGELIFKIFLALLGPEVYSASNRNEHQKQNNGVSGE
jgi:hypothetical protein